MSWTPDDLPPLAGRTYAVTGGTGGLGLEAARHLAAKGGRVVITARTARKADAAVRVLRAAVPGADVSAVLLDLADRDSVRSAARALARECPRLDAIINNAGVMQPPLVRTLEGFELQFAANYLGHVRLNRMLLDRLEAASGRIVSVSSLMHPYGRIRFDDLMSVRRYRPMAAYSQSKLANLLYAFELQRRLEARGSAVASVACHPGYAATNLQSAGVGMPGGSRLLLWIYRLGNRLVAQSAERGSHPLVYAAADPAARPGAYYGPTGLRELRGPVGRARVARHALDGEAARRLWDATEALIGPFFPPNSPSDD